MRRLSRGFIGFAVMVALLGAFAVGGPVAAGTADAGHNYFSAISGGDEVPIVGPGTYGWALYHINDDGQSMTWVLYMSAINDPTAAHIHIGAPRNAGPVVVPLYSGKNVGPFSGVLSSGTITAKDLDGPLKGKTMDDLFAAIKSGNAYTNVHTAVNPGGESRGQIRSGDPNTTAYGVIG